MCLRWLLIVWYVGSLGHYLFGQATYLDEPIISEREFRFREVEQRALDLSKRLGEITGTEPIQLIDRNRSLSPVRYESSAQRAFDVLPGPFQETSPQVEITDSEEELEPVVFTSEVSRVVPTTQQRKGDYYIMPKVGLAFASKTKWKDTAVGSTDIFTLEGDLGNVLGVELARRWDNWLISTLISYQYLDFDQIRYTDSTIQNKIQANEESYSISLNGGYSIPLSEKLSHNGSLGLGFAWRRNLVNRSYLVPANDEDKATWAPYDPVLDSSLVFTYGMSLGFEYLFVNNFSGYFGYRLMGLSSNDSFEGAFQHLLELGVGANF